MVGDRDELLEIQRADGMTRSFVFCLDEPDRKPAFAATNEGRPTPRPRRGADPLRPPGPRRAPRRGGDEVHRPGARGIKLHPRAQRFLPDHPRLEPVFGLAAERSVPILIHGGRGLPPIADSLARLLDRHSPAGADRRPRRDRRPGGDGEELRRHTGRLLRHLRPQHPRPARPLPARPARAGRLRLRLPVRPQPNSLLMAVRTARASGLDDSELGRCSTTRRRGSPSGLTPSSRPRRAARRSSRTPSRSCASTSTSRWPRRCCGSATRRTRTA